MSIINPSKEYKKLVTFGCSFTNGHFTRELGTWGTCLANRLNCEHSYYANSGGSNYAIMSAIINYCERHDISDTCIGVQWTELTRRDLWDSKRGMYFTFEAAAFYLENYNHPEFDITPFRENKDFFLDTWYDMRENILRTVQNMILVQNYLKSKNIDYVMFEGLGSILDNYFPSKEFEGFIGNSLPWGSDLTLIFDETKLKIFEDKSFFTKYGDMKNFMITHPLFDFKANDGHPNIEFCDWWSNEIYEYLKDVNTPKLI